MAGRMTIFPTEKVAGDANTLEQRGIAIEDTPANRNRADLDFTGSVMPPPDAVAGDYYGPGGKQIKVAGLSDEDRLTLVRWIDLGCPIDLDYDPERPEASGYGWMLDDQRPTLSLTMPRRRAIRRSNALWWACMTSAGSFWRASRSSPISRSMAWYPARTWRVAFGPLDRASGSSGLTRR